MVAFLKRYWRRLVLGLLLGWALLPLIQLIKSGAAGRDGAVIEATINLIFVASQTFWISRVGTVGGKVVTGRKWRLGLGALGLVIYVVLLAYNLQNWENVSKGSALSLRAALLEAPMRVWLFGSLLGFLSIAALWCFDRVLRAIAWVYRKVRRGSGTGLLSPDRRRFLEQTAIGCAAAPFIAGAYGLLYARLNLQTTYQRVTLHRLPKAFEGFRIVQLSDLHISAFMTADQIRRFAAIANDLKPDLVALTGDFLTWDESAQRTVVEALSGLRAPFGVFGCLGNHEWLTRTEESITNFFAAQGTRILRNERAAVTTGGSAINVLGVDYQSRRGRTEAPGHPVDQYLPGVQRLMVPDTVNILLSHNPNTFDRAADLGIDLTLSGHTHGGQVTLDFIDARLSPAHVLTDYARGLFRQRDAQLYVNCGIGTIGFPIRLGAQPEITVIELTRQASLGLTH
jgi:predicted MPP superfamily phosphohydrolase